jgi:RNA polymerase sigma factor (sigma-70 family)
MPRSWCRGGRYERPDRGGDEAARGRRRGRRGPSRSGRGAGGGAAPAGSDRIRGPRHDLRRPCVSAGHPHHRQRARCREVVQDALWTAARKIDTFKGESAFGSWLYRITANAAYQKLRSRQSKRQEISWEDLLPTFDEMGAHAEPVRDWSARAEEPALQTELRTVLTTAINDLPGDYRTAFCCTTSRGSRIPRSPRRCTSACPR